MTSEFLHRRVSEVALNNWTSEADYTPENATLSLPKGTTRGADPTASYFQACVVAIGVVGALGNMIVLLLLSFAHHWKYTTNTLIMNQTVIDFMACVFLIVTYVGKLGNRALYGYWDLMYCRLIDSAQFVTSCLHASTTSLVIMTLERYAKIIHPVWHKNNYRRWMTRLGVIVPWIYGFVITFPITWATSFVEGGLCRAVAAWPSTFSRKAYGISTILWKYLLPLLVLLYCYARILYRIRQQGKVHVGPLRNNGRGEKESGNRVGASGSSGQSTQGHMTRAERNILKTLIIVVGCFLLFWLPLQVYYLLVNLEYTGSLISNTYYFTIFFVYFTVCVNPLVYAIKYELFRKSVSEMMKRVRRATTTRTTTDSVNVIVVRANNSSLAP